MSRTPSPPWGSEQCNSSNALPHRLGVVGSATPTMRGPTNCGDAESFPGGNRCLKLELLERTATLVGGSGQCSCCNALPPYLAAIGSATRAMHCHTAWGRWVVGLVQLWAPQVGGRGVQHTRRSLPYRAGTLLRTAPLPKGSGQCSFYNAFPHCLGAVGSGILAMHCHTAGGQWAVQLLQHCHTAWGQWAVQLPQCSAAMPRGSGQCNSYNAMPHCLGAVGSAIPSINYHIASGQSAVGFLQCVGLPAGAMGIA